MARSKRTTMKDWELDNDLAVELERAVEDLQYLLSAHLHGEEEADGWEPPSGYPYCGCLTCEAREVLTLIVPLVAEGYEEGRVRRFWHGIDPAFDNVLTKDD